MTYSSDGPADERDTLQALFVSMAQRSVIFATLVTLAHGALLYYAHDAAGIYSLAIPPVLLGLYVMIGVRNNYPVYLGALLVYLAVIVGFTGFMSMRFGRDLGFIWLLTPIVAILMFNVRLGRTAKLVAVAGLVLYVLWTDYSLGMTPPPVTLPPTIALAIRMINAAVSLATVAGVTLLYYRVIADAHHELQLTSTTDPLTGLFNRRRINEIAIRALSQRRRYHRPVSIILGDVDHFKQINDTFGHDQGDIALKHVAEQLRATARDTDSVGRWGGEEFILVLPETDLEGAVSIAERVRRAISAQGVAGATDVRLTITLGVAEVAEGESLDDSLRRADGALREGKAAGRNRVVKAA